MRYTRPADRNRRGAERYPVHANVRVLCADSMTGVAARMVNVSDSAAQMPPLSRPVPLKAWRVAGIPRSPGSFILLTAPPTM